MDRPAFSAPSCYRCRVGGKARERRHLTLDTRPFAAAPLCPVGPAEVAWAAARYLDQAKAEPLLAALEALDVMDFLS